MALNTTREQIENQARSVANDNKLNSKMLMGFETGLSDYALEIKSMKDILNQTRKMMPSYGERATVLEQKHELIIL